MSDYVSLKSDFDENSDDEVFDTIYDTSDDLELKLPGFKNTQPAMWLGRASLGMLAIIRKKYPSAFTYESPSVDISLDNKLRKITYRLIDDNEQPVKDISESEFIK